MSPTINASTVREFLVGHLAEVFSTMLSLPAQPATEPPPEGAHDCLSGSVGFAGKTVTGAVYLHVPAAFAAHITTTMLGLPPDEAPADADVNDVIGEVTNMLAGGMKSWLCDAGANCALSTPGIIRGSSFRIFASHGVSQIQFPFASNEHRGVLEAHFKFTE